MKRDDGGPAYPTTADTESGASYSDNHGMSLRDWFAGQALSTILGCESFQKQLLAAAQTSLVGEDERDITARVMASRSYRIADAMIAERAK